MLWIQLRVAQLAAALHEFFASDTGKGVVVNSVSLSAYPGHRLVRIQRSGYLGTIPGISEHAVSCGALYQTGLE